MFEMEWLSPAAADAAWRMMSALVAGILLGSSFARPTYPSNGSFVLAVALSALLAPVLLGHRALPATIFLLGLAGLRLWRNTYYWGLVGAYLVALLVPNLFGSGRPMVIAYVCVAALGVALAVLAKHRGSWSI